MAKVTRSTSSSENSSALKMKAGQIASKGTAQRSVYEGVIDQSPGQEARTIWRDVSNRWGAPTDLDRL